MSRQVIDITRRQVLLGAGRATLALPVLPSPLGKTAYGQDPIYTRKPRLYWPCTDHRAAFETSMFPSPTLAVAKQAMFSDHEVGSGTLTGSLEGNTRAVSPILSANSSQLTDALIAK